MLRDRLGWLFWVVLVYGCFGLWFCLVTSGSGWLVICIRFGGCAACLVLFVSLGLLVLWFGYFVLWLLLVVCAIVSLVFRCWVLLFGVLCFVLFVLVACLACLGMC